MTVGVIATGRIGRGVLERLKPFDVKLAYFDKFRLPAEVEAELGATYYASAEELAANVDVISIHAPSSRRRISSSTKN